MNQENETKMKSYTKKSRHDIEHDYARHHTIHAPTKDEKRTIHSDKPSGIFQTDLNWNVIREKSYNELADIIQNTRELHEMMPDLSSAKHTDLLLYIAQHAKSLSLNIFVEGVFDFMPDGYGFIRFAECDYLSSGYDIYVSHQHIRKYQFRIGDKIKGTIRLPKSGEKYCALDEVLLLNNQTIESVLARERVSFEKLTPIFPNRPIKFESKRISDAPTLRLIDIVAPMGFGQRTLIVAPPKAGKTQILKAIAHAIEDNHPEVVLFALLVDERPEEVTEMKRSIRGEVVSSTFDEHATRHVQVTEMTLERARRLVEQGKDVVILLDSITRLGRAYNAFVPSSGKVLSGGIEAAALQRPKKFFGSARNLEEAGSLTIIATALIETGSKMDEVIFEEFKSTGNCEVQLVRALAERNIYPAISIPASSTRRDDLILSESGLAKRQLLKRSLSQGNTSDATESLLKKIKLTKNNDEFFERLSSL